MAEGAGERRLDEVAMPDKPLGDVVRRGGFEWIAMPKNEDEMRLILVKSRERGR